MLADLCILTPSMGSKFCVFSLQPPIYTRQKFHHLRDPPSSSTLAWIGQWFQQQFVKKEETEHEQTKLQVLFAFYKDFP